MKNIFKLNFKILLILFVFSTPSLANENFCLDRTGFIYPIFDETICDNENDKIINKKEFSHIIEFEKKLRVSELKKFRKLEKKLVEETKQKKEIEEKKITLDNDEKQKNIAKLARELKENEKKDIQKQLSEEEKLQKINKRKEEQEKKRLAQKKERELKKQQRLAKIQKRKEEQEKKRLAQKKERELKKQKKAEDVERKRIQKALEKEKKLAELKNKKEKEEKIKAQNEKLKNKIQVVENVNNNLKVLYIDKKIVKNELLPKINPSKEVDYSQLENLDEEKIKNLFANNSNLILIIPKDYDSFSNIISENELTSKYVAGTRSVPNPEFDRLQMELRRAERELLMAKRNEEDGFARTQCYSCGLLTQWGGLAIQSKWQKEGRKIQSRIESLTRKFSSTPQYLENEVLRNYNYIVHNVQAEKSALYQIIQSKDSNYIKKNISITKQKKYKVAYNIDPEDKNYSTLLNKYSNEKDLTRWQNQKLSNISVNDFLKIIDNENNFNEIPGKKELFASLDINIDEEVEEELSWWEKLTGSSKKKKKKTTSLNTQSGSDFELKDVRFDSVVIVKTEKGLGSGFFISKDEILTNYHVIENASSISITDKFKKRSSAVVIKKDLKRDLALLKTNITGKPVAFYEGQLKQGEQVEALGHPKGRKFSLTKGWISAIRMESGGYSATNQKNVLFIQTDAAINHGNSGGPLFYRDKVVGVNTQGLNKEDSEGMNFAVHFSEVKKFLGK